MDVSSESESETESSSSSETECNSADDDGNSCIFSYVQYKVNAFVYDFVIKTDCTYLIRPQFQVCIIMHA